MSDLRFKILPVITLFIIGCATDNEISVVARVGERDISADEFALAYEFAPRSLTNKPAEEARNTVLKQMTDIILLAQEGERLGLGNDQVLRRGVDLYKRQEINRELYLKQVRERVSISDSEAREAYRRSKVKLFVVHQVFSTAAEAHDIIADHQGLVHTNIHPYCKTVRLNNYGLVDIVSWNDVDSRIEDLLYGLAINEISEPVEFGGRYHLFKVVETEQEVFTRENDYYVKRESLEGVIRKRKERLAASEFVDSVMSPQELVIKADALNALSDYLWENRPGRNNQEINFIANAEIDFITDNLQELSIKPIGVFKEGQMTVGDILFNYRVNPQKISYDSKSALRSSLKNMTGLYVRDWVFSEMGIAQQLDKKPAVQSEEQSKYERLVSEKMLIKLENDYIKSTESSKRENEFSAYVDSYIDKIKSKTELTVFRNELMAVNTTDEGLSRKIDFVAIHTQ